MTDLNTIFTSSPRCKRTNPLETIPQAIEDGIIYNVDYTDLKEAVNGALEAAWGSAVKEVYLSNRRGDQDHYGWIVTDNLYYGQGPQIHNLKSVLKKIAKVEKALPDCDLIAPARAICELVAPVIENMNTLKGMIVKGRKPSTNPRKTPERTIENTGTCAVCEMNVKLDKGQHIVAHGYTIRWGFQSGNCHGVGFKAVELSSEGIVSWKGVLEASLAHAEKNIQSLRDAAEVDKNRTTRMAVSQAEATIRYAPRDIADLEKRIANWEPKALPGDKT
ncbi:MAG: hypothetical protein V3S76_00535 [Candidatus Bipolaricaulota bacterium]